jgi:hypothetical protein
MVPPRDQLLLAQLTAEMLRGAKTDADVRDIIGNVTTKSVLDTIQASELDGNGICALLGRLMAEGGADTLDKEERPFSYDTVKYEAHTYAESILENFGFLGDVLDRHEATIHRRWLKKSNKSRRAIILEA